MKRMILLICVFSCTYVFSQTNDYYKQEIIETELSKDNMCKNLKMWVSASFNNSQSVIDYEDKDSGTMVIKFKQSFGGNSKAVKRAAIDLLSNISITIDVKDNKYRYTIPNGTVFISLGNIYSIQKDMNSAELREMANDLRVIVDVGKEYFNDGTDWIIDENYNKIINDYEDKLANIPKINKKGKSNPDWDAMNRKLEILYDIKSGYYSINERLLNSLKNGIMSNNNF